jgi:hypothetical protein
MVCCNNQNIKSSTYSDWCTNCGYSFNYITNSETTHTVDEKSIDHVVKEREVRDKANE